MRRVRAAIVAVQSSKCYIFCVCVYADFIIQHAKRMRHTVICGLSGSTIFFYIQEKKLLKTKCML